MQKVLYAAQFGLERLPAVFEQANKPRSKLAGAGGAVLVVLTFSLIVGSVAFALSHAEALLPRYESWKIMLMTVYWHAYESYIDTGVWLTVPALLLVSWWRPAIPDQPLLSKGLITDAVYSFRYVIVAALLAPYYLVYLRAVFGGVGFVLPTSPIVELPLWAKVIIGYVAVDFIGWLHHYLRHAIPTFWWFHEVHHSQTEMNPLTNGRFHIVDWFLAQHVKFIPASFLMGSFDVALGYLFFHSVHDRLVHSNIRSNLGPLRYIFVTPQSHRVHHSIEREHFDKNFGVSLCVWDRLFGMHHEDEHSYPPTGVKNFPDEQRQSWLQLPICWVKQFAKPFDKAIRGQAEQPFLEKP